METCNIILEIKKSNRQKEKWKNLFSLSSVWEDQAVNGFVLSPEKNKRNRKTKTKRQKDKRI